MSNIIRLSHGDSFMNLPNGSAMDADTNTGFWWTL